MTDRGDLTKVWLRTRNEAGEPTEPTTLKLLLRSPAGVEKSFTWPADPEIVKDKLGHFYYLLDPVESGAWQWRWEATGAVQLAENGTLVVGGDAFEGAPETDGYPTVADLVGSSTLTQLVELGFPQQAALRQEAILAIEGACRQSFAQEGGSGSGEEPVTRHLDGNGGDVVYLPKRLVEVVEVDVPGGGISAESVLLNERRDRLTLRGTHGGTNWLTQAVAEAKGTADRAWPSGAAVIAVTGIWGWAPEEVPVAIATALRYDMEDRATANAHALADTVRSAKALGVSGLRQGNISMQLDGREVAVSTRVRRVLAGAELVWHGPAGALA